MFLHNVFEYAEEDDDVQATRDFATLMDRGYINKYISQTMQEYGGKTSKSHFQLPFTKTHHGFNLSATMASPE